MATEVQVERGRIAYEDEPEDRCHGEDTVREILAAASPTAAEHEAGIEAALQASCARVCSYAAPGAPGSGCYLKCKRPLADFDDESIAEVKTQIRAYLQIAMGLEEPSV